LITQKVVLEEESILEWAISNDYFVNAVLYKNVFDFMKTDKLSFSVMRIYSFDDKDNDGMDIVTDFTITKEGILGTIQKLIEAFERYEEYENCSELLKLEKSLDK